MPLRGKSYVIEVCAICGGHLSNRYNRPGGDGSSAPTGRCGNDRSHWSTGGVQLVVTPLPLDEQPHVRSYGPGLVRRGVIASE